MKKSPKKSSNKIPEPAKYTPTLSVSKEIIRDSLDFPGAKYGPWVGVEHPLCEGAEIQDIDKIFFSDEGDLLAQGNCGQIVMVLPSVPVSKTTSIPDAAGLRLIIKYLSSRLPK